MQVAFIEGFLVHIHIACFHGGMDLTSRILHPEASNCIDVAVGNVSQLGVTIICECPSNVLFIKLFN